MAEKHVSIERFHVILLPSRLRRKTENSCSVDVQEDRRFYGDLHEMSDILINNASNIC